MQVLLNLMPVEGVNDVQADGSWMGYQEAAGWLRQAVWHVIAWPGHSFHQQH